MVFELPVFLVLLGKLGIIDVSFLKRNRKYAILIAFIVAAILTPTPDVVNQVLMGGPLVILYEIGIVAVRIFVRSPPADSTATGEAGSTERNPET